MDSSSDKRQLYLLFRNSDSDVPVERKGEQNVKCHSQSAQYVT